jgi:hypothetical protein
LELVGRGHRPLRAEVEELRPALNRRLRGEGERWWGGW